MAYRVSVPRIEGSAPPPDVGSAFAAYTDGFGRAAQMLSTVGERMWGPLRDTAQQAAMAYVADRRRQAEMQRQQEFEAGLQTENIQATAEEARKRREFEAEQNRIAREEAAERFKQDIGLRSRAQGWSETSGERDFALREQGQEFSQRHAEERLRLERLDAQLRAQNAIQSWSNDRERISMARAAASREEDAFREAQSSRRNMGMAMQTLLGEADYAALTEEGAARVPGLGLEVPYRTVSPSKVAEWLQGKGIDTGSFTPDQWDAFINVLQGQVGMGPKQATSMLGIMAAPTIYAGAANAKSNAESAAMLRMGVESLYAADGVPVLDSVVNRLSQFLPAEARAALKEGGGISGMTAGVDPQTGLIGFSGGDNPAITSALDDKFQEFQKDPRRANVVQEIMGILGSNGLETGSKALERGAAMHGALQMAMQRMQDMEAEKAAEKQRNEAARQKAAAEADKARRQREAAEALQRESRAGGTAGGGNPSAPDGRGAAGPSPAPQPASQEPESVRAFKGFALGQSEPGAAQPARLPGATGTPPPGAHEGARIVDPVKTFAKYAGVSEEKAEGAIYGTKPVTSGPYPEAQRNISKDIYSKAMRNFKAELRKAGAPYAASAGTLAEAEEKLVSSMKTTWRLSQKQGNPRSARKLQETYAKQAELLEELRAMKRQMDRGPAER